MEVQQSVDKSAPMLYSFFQKRLKVLPDLKLPDLLECEKELKDIRATLDIKNKDVITIYNEFIRKFNTVRPENPLPRVMPETLQKLMKECLHEPVTHFPEDLLSSSEPATIDHTANYLAGLEIYEKVEEWHAFVENFQKKGGTVAFLPCPSFRERYPPCIGISTKTVVYTVCHAGLIRSQTVRQLVVSIKEMLGQTHADLETPLSHGILHGHDPSTRPSNANYAASEELYGEHYQAAFGIKRPPRFGSDVNEESAHLHFRDNYYKIKSTGTSNVFVTFMDNGFTVMRQLEKENGDLRGVSVVLFGDWDRISNCELSQEMLHKVRCAYEKERETPGKRRPIESLTEKERRDVFLTYTEMQKPEEAPGSLDNILALFDQFKVDPLETISDHEINRVFKIEAFRAWSHRLGGAFKPLLERKRERDQ